MESRQTLVPDPVDGYLYTQRITIVVRWFLLLTWALIHNYRPELNPTYFINNGLALTLAVLNGYAHWLLVQGRPMSWRYVVALSISDLAMITAGIFTSTGFGNTFFVLYYPALLGLALVSPWRRLSFGGVVVTAIAYASLSIALEPGVNFDMKEEKVLLIRLATMFAVVAAGNLIVTVERRRRREALDAERAQANRNLELQKQAQEAELAAQEERSRIAREIHDGIAQSIYALSLNLETCADLAERDKGPLRDRLKDLVPIAKKTLLETRQYIFDLKPLLSGELDLKAVAESQVREFRTVAGTPVELSVDGEPGPVSVTVATGFYRILQEALANIMKHADASQVWVALSGDGGQVRMSVEDNGTGFNVDGGSQGYGLDNMRHRAQELGGALEVATSPGAGTSISVTLPSEEEAK